MRILHTSDWHLGRHFHGQSMEDDHAAILEQVYDALIYHKPDVMIIAGDIFDRASPPARAVGQFNNFIRRVAADTSTSIVLIAGNHDSGDRIDAMSLMADEGRALIRGPLVSEEKPLIIHDEFGPVAFSALPFGYEYEARVCFGRDDISCPADVMREQVASAKVNLPENARWVIVAHAFVVGASPSESERNLARVVGGIETISAEVFDGAHYVALGHLHRPQTAGGQHIRYSGSPLAFGFDEDDHNKSMTLIDMDKAGLCNIEELPFTPKRRVRVLKGKLEDLLASGKPSEDFVKIVLTNETRLIDPIKQIRTIYPNTSLLTYERHEQEQKVDGAKPGVMALSRPEDVISAFLAHVRGESQSDEEKVLVKQELVELKGEEA